MLPQGVLHFVVHMLDRAGAASAVALVLHSSG